MHTKLEKQTEDKQERAFLHRTPVCCRNSQRKCCFKPARPIVTCNRLCFGLLRALARGNRLALSLSLSLSPSFLRVRAKRTRARSPPPLEKKVISTPIGWYDEQECASVEDPNQPRMKRASRPHLRELYGTIPSPSTDASPQTMLYGWQHPFFTAATHNKIEYRTSFPDSRLIEQAIVWGCRVLHSFQKQHINAHICIHKDRRAPPCCICKAVVVTGT